MNVTDIREFRIKHVADKHDAFRVAAALMEVEDLNQDIERLYQAQRNQEKNNEVR
jgi:hypothetical protein